MKRIVNLTILFALFTLVSCGQEKDNPKKIVQSTVTREQYNSISKSIKTFDYNPTYQFRFTSVFCSYEVYVNDILVTFSYTTASSAGEQSVDIPQYILKTGVQDLRIKLYPRAHENGAMDKGFRNTALFKGRIVHGDYGNNIGENYKEVITFSAPPLNSNQSGYEIKKKFEAEVPYLLKGWTTGVDLRKENKEGLNKEVLAVYQRFVEAYKNNDVPTIASMIYKREQEVAQAFFFKSGEPKSYDQGWEAIENEAKGLEDIKIVKDREMRFFAEGKIVALLQPKGENRSCSVIEGETKDSYIYYVLYLYRSKPTGPLEVIR